MLVQSSWTPVVDIPTGSLQQRAQREKESEVIGADEDAVKATHVIVRSTAVKALLRTRDVAVTDSLVASYTLPLVYLRRTRTLSQHQQ